MQHLKPVALTMKNKNIENKKCYKIGSPDIIALLSLYKKRVFTGFEVQQRCCTYPENPPY